MSRSAICCLFLATVSAAQPPTDVLPIFKTHCQECHSGNVKMKELDLSSQETVLKGSEGGPVVKPGKPDESRLYQLVRDGKMPMGKPRLSEVELARIRAWIEAVADSEDMTQHDIIPILLARCTVCHGLRRKEAGLDLTTRASMLRGGKSGPAVVPGKPDESRLIQKIRSGDMPPRKMMLEVSVRPITEAETERIAKWIARGAPEGNVRPDVAGLGPDALVSDRDRQFWAFQPPRAVALPKVHSTGRVRNPIDAFILGKLEERGLPLSPEADRVTLIRRASFDLTGLPPEPEEVRAFLADRDPKAYEKVIERLLASPRYGERWGRYWLDAAGYAESEGKLNSDPIRPTAFRYRDYVIRAFNSDKPYDRFLLEQIAGDELADYEKAPVVTQEIMDNLIATGFLRMAADATNQRDMNLLDDRHEVIADEIDIFGSTVLGLTIKCARCHSHKYEPIPQRDYFRLADIFKGALDEHDWLAPTTDKRNPGRDLPYVSPGATPVQVLQEEREREARNRELQEQIDPLQTALKEKEEQAKKKIWDQRLPEIPESLREDVRKMLATPPDKRDAAQKYLAQKFEKQLQVSTAELKRLDPAYRREIEGIERQVKLLEASRPAEPKIRALWDRGTPSPTYILRRGSPTSFGRLVGPGVPSVLTDGQTPFEVKIPWPGAKSTGRRLALARWVIQPNHPLTARVMVNRIWARHFGTGIVKTVDNFGVSGAPPSHPDLLDWLAVEFVRRGWSIKEMHRLLMTSSVYRQSSKLTPAHEKLDPDNALLSRMPVRRMEAEALYDTLLLVSGRLDETRYGFPSPVQVREDGLVTPIGTERGWRRSIYTLHRRKDIPTVLASFDFPQMSPNCQQRIESNVAQQALLLQNDAMVRQLSESFARRVEADAGHDPARQVERVYWLALSRSPTAEERQISLETLSKLRTAFKDAETTALAKLCHSILNTAAFLYID